MNKKFLKLITLVSLLWTFLVPSVIAGGAGYTSGGGGGSLPAPGSDGNVLTASGGNWTSAAPSGGASAGVGLETTLDAGKLNFDHQYLRYDAHVSQSGNLFCATGDTSSQTHGTSSGGGASSAINNGVSGIGRCFKIQTGTTAGIQAGFAQQQVVPKYDSKPIYYAVIKTGSAGETNSHRFWCGLGAGTAWDLGGVAVNEPASNVIGFRYSTGVPDTNFKAYSGKSGGSTTTDTGVAFAADTTYIFKIDASDTASVKYYISTNGGAFALVATHTTNLPSTSEDMYNVCRIMNLTAVNQAFYAKRFGFFYK